LFVAYCVFFVISVSLFLIHVARNLSSRINMHTHPGSTFDYHVTLIFDFRVIACQAAVMHCMSTKFGVDRLSCFSFRVRTHTDPHCQPVSGTGNVD